MFTINVFQRRMASSVNIEAILHSSEICLLIFGWCLDMLRLIKDAQTPLVAYFARMIAYVAHSGWRT